MPRCLEKTTSTLSYAPQRMKDPISGLRAACTKLLKRFSPRLFRFSNRPTTLATRDVLEPRDSAARIREPAASPYKKETF